MLIMRYTLKLFDRSLGRTNRIRVDGLERELAVTSGPSRKSMPQNIGVLAINSGRPQRKCADSDTRPMCWIQ